MPPVHVPSQDYKRLYRTYRWRKASEQFRQQHPLCAEHLKRGVSVRSQVTDHIEPHHGDPRLFWNAANWQALCKPCHDSHKKRLEQSGTIAGSSIEGIPADPSHPWHKGREG